MSGRDKDRKRWPYLGPPQRAILFASFGIFLGTALPWAAVVGRFLWGSPVAITWTLSAGFMALAAGMVRWRLLVVPSAALGGATAVFFAAWQTMRILDRCGLTIYCLPGPGLGLLLIGGLVAVYQSARLVGLGPVRVPSRGRRR